MKKKEIYDLVNGITNDLKLILEIICEEEGTDGMIIRGRTEDYKLTIKFEKIEMDKRNNSD